MLALLAASPAPALLGRSKSQTHTTYMKLGMYKIQARGRLLWQHITVQQKPLDSPAGHLCLRRLHLRTSVSPNCSASCLGPRRGPTCAVHSKGLSNHIVCYLSRWQFCHPSPCFMTLYLPAAFAEYNSMADPIEALPATSSDARGDSTCHRFCWPTSRSTSAETRR